LLHLGYPDVSGNRFVVGGIQYAGGGEPDHRSDRDQPGRVPPILACKQKSVRTVLFLFVLGVWRTLAPNNRGAILHYQPDEPLEIRREPFPSDPFFDYEMSAIFELDLTKNGEIDVTFVNLLRPSSPPAVSPDEYTHLRGGLYRLKREGQIFFIFILYHKVKYIIPVVMHRLRA